MIDMILTRIGEGLKNSAMLKQLTDNALPNVVRCSIAMPHDETTSNADKTKLLLPWSDERRDAAAPGIAETARDDGDDGYAENCDPWICETVENPRGVREWNTGLCRLCIQAMLPWG
jgi:hypothetical protein